MEPRQKWVESRGHRIRYLTLGDGPVVVLLHGFTQSADSWVGAGVVDLLAEHRRVIAIDRLGHGGSDAPIVAGAHDEQHSIDDIGAVLRAEAVDRAVFWGYSLGARSAMSYAIHDPEQVTGLIQGSAPPFDHDAFGRFADAVDGLLAAQGVEALYRSLGETDPAVVADAVESNNADALRACLAGSRGASPNPERVPSPWLYYYGASERPGPSDSDLARATRHGAVHVLDGAGHLDCFNRGARDVADFVIPFLDGLSGDVSG